MIEKKTLLAWLKNKSVSVLSADVEGLPGLPGQMVTIIVTNNDLTHILEGANVAVEEPEDDEETKRRKEKEAAKIQEGWETDPEDKE